MKILEKFKSFLSTKEVKRIDRILLHLEIGHELTKKDKRYIRNRFMIYRAILDEFIEQED